MLYWIFDLDLTLYQLPNNTEFSYDHLFNDEHLGYLLSKLPCKKLIFTNGTYNHAITSLKKIDVINKFDNIEARDTINSLKPSPNSFNTFISKNNIFYKDKCVFFDDMPENLISSKNFNWITVLINKKNHTHEYIDFWFPNIYLALNFFLCKIQNNITM
jgi:putative hydrolase of the HAD superfamily